MPSILGSFGALQYGGVVVYPLLGLALVGGAIMLDKAYVYLRFVRLPGDLVGLMDTYDFDWDVLDARLAALGPRNLVAGFFRSISTNRAKPAWWIESRSGDEAHFVQVALNRGLWVLETIVTGAPLLGLLGTITGMMNAFKIIGNHGLVDPSGVTAGVAQALIATALGLLIAIVALFGFNFFARQQAKTMDELERLGTRLINHVRLDQETAGGRIPHEVA